MLKQKVIYSLFLSSLFIMNGVNLAFLGIIMNAILLSVHMICNSNLIICTGIFIRNDLIAYVYVMLKLNATWCV